MNVIGINGSPGKQWNRATLVTRALEGATAVGAASTSEPKLFRILTVFNSSEVTA